MTHKELVKVARVWLRMAKKCNPVFVEQGSSTFAEMPDGIGFRSNETIVVECKASKADLRADKKKPHRKKGGLGDRRFYFMTKDMYEECKDHDWDGWGVVIVDSNHGARQVRGMDSQEFKSSMWKERAFLRSRVMEIQRFGM